MYSALLNLHICSGNFEILKTIFECQFFRDPRTNLCRAMSFSNNGKMLAYCDSQRLVCVDTSNGNEIFDHPLAKVTKIMFSPDDQLMVTYEPYVIYGSRVDGEGNTRKPDPNLNFFDCTNGKLITTLIQKNQVKLKHLLTEINLYVSECLATNVH